MKRGTIESAGRAVGALLLALAFSALLKPPAQAVLARLSGAVIPNATYERIEYGGRVKIVSIAGERRLPWGDAKRAAALHVVAVVPAGAAGGDGARSAIDFPGPAIGSAREAGGGRGDAWERDVEVTYDPFWRTATIGGVVYRLRRGNLFVVRMTGAPRPVVTQLDTTIVAERNEPGVLRVVCSRTRDAEVRSEVSTILDLREPFEERGRGRCHEDSEVAA
jgi:hypothetical protein